MPADPTVPIVKERLVFGFNTFYGELLSSVAKSDDLLKKRLKKGYRVLDRKSDVYLTEFRASALELGVLGRVFDDGARDDEVVGRLQVTRGIRFGEIPSDEFPRVRLLCAFAWLLGELASASEEPDESRHDAVVAVNELFERLIESASRIQSGMSWGSGLDGMVDDEARDVFRATLSELAAARGAAGEAASRITGAEADDMTSAFEMMKCSKLGSIVQEISSMINKEDLRKAVESGDLTGGFNMEMMGDVFKKVSTAITGKLESGELSQDDLLRETTSLMSSLKGAAPH